MEMDIRSRRFEMNRPDWLAGGVAGFVAGAILMVLEMIGAASELGGNPWITTHKIAAIVLGGSALQQMNQFDVGIVTVALVIHYVLGIFTGVVAAAIISGWRLDDKLEKVLLIGLILGTIIYLVNFHVMTAAFPWFVDMRGAGTWLLHMIFGVTAAAMYWELGRIG